MGQGKLKRQRRRMRKMAEQMNRESWTANMRLAGQQGFMDRWRIATMIFFNTVEAYTDQFQMLLRTQQRFKNADEVDEDSLRDTNKAVAKIRRKVWFRKSFLWTAGILVVVHVVGFWILIYF